MNDKEDERIKPEKKFGPLLRIGKKNFSESGFLSLVRLVGSCHTRCEKTHVRFSLLFCVYIRLGSEFFYFILRICFIFEAGKSMNSIKFILFPLLNHHRMRVSRTFD